MMIPPATDLFGEVPVTTADLYEWCERVNFHHPAQWRLDWYIKNWNVAEKVRQAKLDGSWYKTS